MTQQTVSMIVHEIVGASTAWRDDGHYITNGYYRVAHDGSRYGMGVSTYISEPVDADSLKKAVDVWKHKIGWQPTVPIDDASVRPGVPVKVFLSTAEGAYKEFVENIRNSVSSYSIHENCTTLLSSIEKALNTLDGRIHTMEKIEGR